MWAQLLLVRSASAVLREGLPTDAAKPLQSFLTSCLDSYRSDMVMLEAARAVCTLPGFGQREFTMAITGAWSFGCHSVCV